MSKSQIYKLQQALQPTARWNLDQTMASSLLRCFAEFPKQSTQNHYKINMARKQNYLNGLHHKYNQRWHLTTVIYIYKKHRTVHDQATTNKSINTTEIFNTIYIYSCTYINIMMRRCRHCSMKDVLNFKPQSRYKYLLGHQMKGHPSG